MLVSAPAEVANTTHQHRGAVLMRRNQRYSTLVEVKARHTVHSIESVIAGTILGVVTTTKMAHAGKARAITSALNSPSTNAYADKASTVTRTNFCVQKSERAPKLAAIARTAEQDSHASGLRKQSSEL
jgi:hypothetical protein